MRTLIPREVGLLVSFALTIAGCAPQPGSEVSGIDGTGVVRNASISYGAVTTSDLSVNGVQYSASTATITIDGQPGTEAELHVGNVVLVKGNVDSVNRTGIANDIAADYVVHGRLDSIDAASNSAVVLGQTVRIEAATTFDDALASKPLADLAGEVVRVAGFRDGTGAISAARVEPQRLGAPLLATTGVVANLDSAAKRFSINALVVDYSAAALQGSAGGPLGNGQLVHVSGSALAADGSLTADSVTLVPDPFAANSGSLVQIEGYVTSLSASDPMRFTVDGRLQVEIGATTVLDGGKPALNWRVFAEGTLDSQGVLVAKRVQHTSAGLPAYGDYTLSGRVFDAYTGPVASAYISPWIELPDGSGFSWVWAHGGSSPPVNSKGEFSLQSLPYSQVTLFAGSSYGLGLGMKYLQQCGVVVDVHGDVSADIELTSVTTLSQLSPPKPQSATAPTLTGIVYETVNGARQPIAGATVWVEDMHEIPTAATVTDLSGHYFLCRLPAASDVTVEAQGFSLNEIWPVDGVNAQTLDVELHRK